MIFRFLSSKKAANVHMQYGIISAVFFEDKNRQTGKIRSADLKVQLHKSRQRALENAED